MIKVNYEDLIINLLIVLKEKHNILEISNKELEVYKQHIFKSLRTEGKIINICKGENDYSKYLKERKVYEDFYIYSLNPKVSLTTIKKKFYDDLSTKYKEAYTNNKIIEDIVDSIRGPRGGFKTSKTYNKLVRDKIPGILATNKENPKAQIILEKNHKEELYKALSNTYMEFINSFSDEDKIRVASDLVELLASIIKYDSGNDLLKEVSKLRKAEGSFDKMLFLEEIESNLKMED